MTDPFSNVWWLGGGSGAGKSTVARRLAERHGMALYSCDDAMADHAARLSAEEAPLLAAFLQMCMDERWVTRAPEAMLETFHWFAGEGFGLIVQDLTALSARGPVIAEGFRLLPRLVLPHLADRSRGLWLLPTQAFRRDAFTARGSLWEIAGRTGDHEAALANLLARDALFTRRLQAQLAGLGLPSLVVDGARTEDELVRDVEGRLGLAERGGQVGACPRPHASADAGGPPAGLQLK